MKYTIYLSGCRVAEWSEETGYTYKTAPELIASYLEEMRMGEAELRERLACAQEAISQGEAEFILPSGERYCRRDEKTYIEPDIKYPVDLLITDGRIIGFHQPALTFSLTGVIEEFENQTVIGEWNQLYGGEVYDYQPPETIKLIMRDGCSLATDIYLPKGAPLPLPCVLVRTPGGRPGPKEPFPCPV